jgi:hypothetical protein
LDISGNKENILSLKLSYYKVLKGLIAANIALDVIAVLIWGLSPATQWSIYRLGFSVVGSEAAIAAVVFGFALFGLVKMKSWAPKLVIAVTVFQRVFGTFVFFPSLAIFVTLAWSLIIIFIAHRTIDPTQTL